MNKPYQIAKNHQSLIRVGLIRFAIVVTLGGMLGLQATMLISICFGALMAYFGYRCCAAAFGSGYGVIAGAFLFFPYGRFVSLLVLNGSIGDKLYKHCGSVGLFGATDEQLEKLLQLKEEAGVAESTS